MARRKFFSATVVLPATTATSVLTLMQNSVAAWCGTNSPNDAVVGRQMGFVPDATVYVGHDSSVRDADATPLYKGVSVAASENYSLPAPGSLGTVDSNHIWLYAPAQTNVKLTFQGS